MKRAHPHAEIEQSGLEGTTPRMWNMAAVLRLVLHTTMPWSGAEYVGIYRSVIRILHDVRPDVVAIDPALGPATTACRHLGDRFLVLAPNTMKDLAVLGQEVGEVFWKSPWGV
jgi:hypothetical protein